MKGDGTTLGDRMKFYEKLQRTTLPRELYSIIRVDGRAFHTLLRNSKKPFDLGFMLDMDRTATALCKEIQGAVFAYTQSDEISVLVADPNPKSEPWFGGIVQKQVSIAAAKATMEYNRYTSDDYGPLGMFDARVFHLPNAEEVANYFIWRKQDCIRNAVSMAAQAHFSPKELHGKKSSEMIEMLRGKGVEWSDYPEGARHGRIVTRQTGERQVAYIDKRSGEQKLTTALRSWWETRDAPPFAHHPDGWLAQNIPALPEGEL